MVIGDVDEALVVLQKRVAIKHSDCFLGTVIFLIQVQNITCKLYIYTYAFIYSRIYNT